MPRAGKKRGQCRICLLRFGLRENGTIGKHKACKEDNEHCKGTGLKPVSYLE